MNILENPNPANIFLSMYDACIVTNNEEFCKDQVASLSPQMVKTYLSVYSACRRIAGPDTCKDLMAPKTSPAQLVIGFIIGVALGLALRRS